MDSRWLRSARPLSVRRHRALCGIAVALCSLATAAHAAADARAPLQFHDLPSGAVRAGHATLQWTPHPQADAYRLHDQRRRVIYRGRFATAFVSGLTDGRQRFWVSALDARGNVIARGSQPAVVVVRHWPLPLTWGLFGVGAIVVAALAGLLIGGALAARREQAGGRDALGDSPASGPAVTGPAVTGPTVTGPAPTAPAAIERQRSSEGAER